MVTTQVVITPRPSVVRKIRRRLGLMPPRRRKKKGTRMTATSVTLKQDVGYMHDGGDPGDMDEKMQRPMYVVIRAVNTVDYLIGSVHEKADVTRMIQQGVTVTIQGAGKRKM